jgi:hypothetical protein
MADLVAGAARHSIVERRRYADWYEDHLAGYARQTRKKEIEVSGHALSQLKKRSRTDVCGSGWKNAQVIR